MKNFMLADVPKLRAHPEKHEGKEERSSRKAAAPVWMISCLGQQ
jgi:hypothetical protein